MWGVSRERNMPWLPDRLAAEVAMSAPLSAFTHSDLRFAAGVLSG